MKNYTKWIVGISIMALTLSGCGNSDSQELESLKAKNNELQKQVDELQEKNDELESKIAMYVPKNTSKSASNQEITDQPVKLVSIEFDKSFVTDVYLKFENISGKTIDAIEFVILQYDNFGRPAYRFNDPSDGNVTNLITMQGSAAPGAVMQGAWTLYNTEKTTKGKTVVKQVHFTDDSVWTNKKFDKQVDDMKNSLN